MVSIEWKGNMVFEANPPTGNRFVMDSHPDHGGTNHGPTPVEAFLAAAGACSAMDVLAILQKKRQVVTGYRIEVSGERGPVGEFPRPFLSVQVKHILQGENLDPEAIERAVRLSDEKYCTVLATLRHVPEVQSVWVVEP